MTSWSFLLTIGLLCLACTFSILKIIFFVWSPDEEESEVDSWLEEHDLHQHQKLFRENGNFNCFYF